MKPFLNLMPVDEALQLIHSAAPLPVEEVPLAAAAGRRMGADFHASADLPGFPRSTVDGYACRSADTFGASEGSPALLRAVGAIAMGEPASLSLGDGEAAAIPTGGMLPEGADCAAMIECCRPVGADLIEVIAPLAPGANIALADQDARKGALLIPRGKKLRPPEIGILAAFGASAPLVFKQPKAAVISTGDEILPIGEAPGAAQIRDVNTWSLGAFCLAHGCAPLPCGIIGDDEDALAEAVGAALRVGDLALISGGSSAGGRDHTVAAFARQPDAEILCHGVAISPGKPLIIAKSRGKFMLGLPGHVAGALVCAHVFLGPLLARLQGASLPELRPSKAARLASSIASPQGRRDYIRCRLRKEGGEWLADPIPASSAVLASLLEADGFAVCPENRSGLAKGELVDIELL